MPVEIACPVCHHTVQLLADGYVVAHGVPPCRFTRTAGTGRQPEGFSLPTTAKRNPGKPPAPAKTPARQSLRQGLKAQDAEDLDAAARLGAALADRLPGRHAPQGPVMMPPSPWTPRTVPAMLDSVLAANPLHTSSTQSNPRRRAALGVLLTVGLDRYFYFVPNDAAAEVTWESDTATHLTVTELPSPSGFAILSMPGADFTWLGARMLAWALTGAHLTIALTALREGIPSDKQSIPLGKVITETHQFGGDGTTSLTSGRVLGRILAGLSAVVAKARLEPEPAPPGPDGPTTPAPPRTPPNGSTPRRDGDVTVVYAHPRRGRTGETEVLERDFRWTVRGHWRRQWYPSTEEHRPVWIEPHESGPTGKPLRQRDIVTVITSTA
jgi:hypothetical protein